MSILHSQLVHDKILQTMETQGVLARSLGHLRRADVWEHANRQLANRGNRRPLLVISQLKRLPVTIDEFVESPDFLGKTTKVWPELMEDLRRLNPDVFVGEEPIHEAYLGGATGIGKSTLARISLLYQIYLLTCLRNPQQLFGLEPHTTFVFPLQSVTPEVTRRVLYEPFRRMFEGMPFAQKHLEWDKRRTTSLEIAGGIHVVPLVAGIEQILGQAIPGAILDEVNFMRIVEKSVRVAGPRGLGGRYDQAEEVASELLQRRKSRFLNPLVSIGSIFYCSSTRYIGDFLERNIDEIEASPRANVFWSRHARYDVVPKSTYSGETFRLLLGDDSHRTRPLDDGEEEPEGAQIEHVPVEHLAEFRRDPEAALRTILGIAVASLSPFIGRRETIEDAIERGFDFNLQPWTEKSEIDLTRDGWPDWIEDALPEDRAKPRFIHVDLSLSCDACGIAVVKLQGIRNEDRGDDLIEAKPHFVVEAALAIRPSPEAEIQIADVLSSMAELVNDHRFNVVSVSSDKYRAADFRQALGSLSVRVQEISVDETPMPYERLRDCLYEGRLALVESEILEKELIELERNKTGRVDHPPRGSKDVADAVAGALFAAITNGSIRADTGYFDSDGYRPESPRTNPPRPRGTRRRRRIAGN